MLPASKCKGRNSFNNSNKFLLLFLALSMLGSIKIYIGGNLNWLILILLLLAAVKSSSLHEQATSILQSCTALLKPYAPMLTGWGLFMGGILIAGLMNDGTGLYTLAKYIALLFVLLMLLIIGISTAQLEKALIWALAASIIPLLFFVAFRLNGLLIILGDGRMGWLAIWPGVLWKVGAFIWPFALWRCIKKPSYKTFSLAFAAILAMALDGSRTSMLWLILTWFTLIGFSIWFKHTDRAIRKQISILFMVIFTFGVLQPITLKWINGEYDHLFATQGETSTIRETIRQWDAIIPSLTQKSTSQRMATGDTTTRAEMLQKGWLQVIDTFPFGCGFGCAGVQDQENHIVIHMTYLQILADSGLISLIGYMLFMLYPLYCCINYLTEKRGLIAERFDLMLTPISILLLYLFTGLLHPVSNELTEWAIVLAAISIIMTHVTRRH